MPARASLPLAFADAVQREHITWFWLAELQLLSGTVRLAGLDFDVEWGGQTWVGARGLGSIAPIEETPNAITGLQLALAGVTEAHIANVLGEPIQGRPVIIRLAVLDATTEPPSLAVDPNVWQGLLDVQRFNEAGATVTVNAENRLVEWDRPRLLRYSDADHRRLWPGDGFFRLAAAMAEREIIIFSKEALARRV
jgi:hypothetical protein